jgi:hypothetical protein
MKKLKERLIDSEAARSQAVSVKLESDAKIREQTRRIDDIGNELLRATNLSKNAELQSKESNKMKGDTVKETRRLLEENEQLQNEVNNHVIGSSAVISRILMNTQAYQLVS